MTSQSNDNQDPPVRSQEQTDTRTDSLAFEEVTGLTNTDFSDAFDEARDRALQDVSSQETWDKLEKVGRVTNRVDDVAATYRKALNQQLEENVAEPLAQRAIAYHDEWLEDQQLVKQLLSQTLQLVPTAYWALERLSVLLTVDSAWDELLDCYDRAILASESEDQRLMFLHEAASIAKDLAGKPKKAIGYLEQLFSLEPSDRQVVSSLERLYRHESKFTELVSLWNKLVPISTGKAAGKLRVKEATCWLEDLNQPAKALEIARDLKSNDNTVEEALQLLKKIISSRLSDLPTRTAAIQLLGEKLDDTPRWQEVLEPIEQALTHVSSEEALTLRGELIIRLAKQGALDHIDDHMAILIAFQPSKWTSEHIAHLLEGTIDEETLGTELQLEKEHAHRLVHQAAHIALDDANDWDRAVALYQEILSSKPDDLEAIEQLSKLYADANRSTDLLALREHELSLEENLEKRLQLRLEVASLLQTLERSDEACKRLRNNLEEMPGHRPSVEALSRILRTREQFEQLTTMLSEQAKVVQQNGDDYEAANLWMQAARVADEQLNDQVKAMDHYARVVALQPNTNALDALARIHTERQEPHLAVGWLEKRLELTLPTEQEETIVKLADAYEAAGELSKAIEHLRDGLDAQPDSSVLRRHLGNILRTQGRWNELVSLLLDGADNSERTEEKFGYLRDAADVYLQELERPTEAIPVLRRAVKLSPADRGIRADLADALRESGEYEEARRLAEGLIEEFGRRHPPERAKLHLLLARILQSEDNKQEALEQLERASTMDVGNVSVQHLLAQLYQESGDLEKAERTYRALLLLLRRKTHRTSAQSKKRQVDAGVAETLFELYRIAALKGDTTRAEENLASAFDAATQNLDEAIRFERAIRRANDTELLQRALRQRLELAETPLERAGILTDMSTLLAESLGRSEEALTALLDAMKEAPDNQDVFTKARSLAKTLDALEPLVTLLGQLAESAQQAGNDELACTLYLRLSQLESQDRHNMSRAKELLENAAQTHVQHANVWLAQSELAREMNDEDWEQDTLENILTLDDKEISPEDRLVALTRLIALQLQKPNTLAQGIEALIEAQDQGLTTQSAFELLDAASERFPEDASIIEHLEALSRKLADDEKLLSVLVRRVRTFEVSQDVIRETVSLAEKLEEQREIEALLRRSVDLAGDAETPTEALWAINKLSERAKKQQVWSEAVEWLLREAELKDGQEARALRAEAADIAWQQLEDFDLASKQYEMLLEDDPADESGWRPLMELLEKNDERDRLLTLLSTTADALSDDNQRIALRTKRASLLLDMPDSAEEAIQELEKILEQAPDNADAADLSIRLFREQGRTDELRSLLRRQLDIAAEQGLEERGAKLAHELAEQLVNTSPEEALEVYRSAVGWTARNELFLRGYMSLLQSDDQAQERAQVIERLLADPNIDDAADLVLDLVEAREQEGDREKLELALERAFEIAPDNTRTLSYFEAFAERLESEASELDNPEEAAALYTKSADIYISHLNDAESATKMLGQAADLRPKDHELLMRLVESLLETGNQQDAIDRLTSAIEMTDDQSPERSTLLVAKSHVWKRIGEFQPAIEDMQAAVAISGDELVPELRDLLVDYRDNSLERIDAEGERFATLALVDLDIQLGNEEDARSELTDWVDRNTDDLEAIRRLLDLERKTENWERIKNLSSRVIDLEDGDDRIPAALEFARACSQLQLFDEARDTLEMLYRDMPHSADLRGQLRDLYERSGAHQKLAEILAADASQEQDPEVRFGLLKRAGELRLKDEDSVGLAIAPLAEAYSIHPEDNETVLMLVDAYIDTDMIAEAVEILQQAMEQYSGRRSKELAALQRRMAHAAAKSDRYTEMQWLQAAFDTYSQDMVTAAELAELATQLEEYDLAVKALRTLATAKTEAPITRAEAFLKQAQIAHIQKDMRKATFLVKKALSLDPELQEAVALFEDLSSR